MTPNSNESLGPYDLLAPKGASGRGEIFCAQDTRLNREAAIKILPKQFANNPERLRRFERETKTLAAVKRYKF